MMMLCHLNTPIEKITNKFEIFSLVFIVKCFKRKKKILDT